MRLAGAVTQGSGAVNEDGYGVIGPFLNPAIQMQMERVRAYGIWILILALWYLPFVGSFFWGIIFLISSIFGVNWTLAMQGSQFLTGFFRDLLR